MKPINLDKTHILLAAIVAICVIALVTMFLAFRADEVDRAIRSDRIDQGGERLAAAQRSNATAQCAIHIYGDKRTQPGGKDRSSKAL